MNLLIGERLSFEADFIQFYKPGDAELTVAQIRLLLTRIGRHSKMILSGDLDQSDLYEPRNGLSDAVLRFKDMKGVAAIHLTEQSVIRNPLIIEIERRYKKDTNF